MDMTATVPDLEERFCEPPGWQWGEMQSQGFTIRFGHVSPPEPEAIIVCLPGLSEFCEKYFETARDVLNRNMAFWVIDWPGQGRSERMLKLHEQRRHSFGFEVERDILHDLFTQHIEPSNKKGVSCAMLAHSMGGHIGLRYLEAYPWVFCCAGFSAPMWGLTAFKAYPGPLPGLVTGLAQMYMGGAYGPGQTDWSAAVREVPELNIFSHDEARARVHNAWCVADERLRVGGVTWRWLYEVVKSCAVIWRRTFLRDIRVPCLIATAGKDALVDNMVTARMAKMLPRAELINFEEAFHEILMERDAVRGAFLEKFFALVDSAKGR